MAALWGNNNGGQAGQFPLEQWFYEMPPCTRWWTTATVVTSVLVQCNILTPFQLFYSFHSAFVKSQVGVLSFLYTLLALFNELPREMLARRYAGKEDGDCDLER